MLVATHLFIPGPTNIPEAVRSAMDIRMEDMRTPDFPKFTLPLFEDLKKAFKLTMGRVFIYPSSGIEVAPGSGTGAAVEYFRNTTTASATAQPEVRLKLAS